MSLPFGHKEYELAYRGSVGVDGKPWTGSETGAKASDVLVIFKTSHPD